MLDEHANFTEILRLINLAFNYSDIHTAGFLVAL